MSFLDFSNELIIKTISNLALDPTDLDYSLHRRTLLSLSKTCKLLNLLSNPYLYSIITYDDNGESYWPCLFLRTILHRPDLAKLTKTFHFEASVTEACSDFRPFLNELSLATWGLIRTKINEASAREGHANTWYQVIRNLDGQISRRNSAIMTLIIDLLTNLMELNMTNWTYGYEFFGPLLARATALQQKHGASGINSQPCSMSKLEAISIINFKGDNGILDLSDVIEHLKLLSIKKFVAQAVFHDDFYDELSRPLENFTSHVHDLRIPQGCIPPRTLKRFLHCCPHLRRFSYAQGFFSYDEDKMFNPQATIDGLMASKQTLEIIEADSYYDELYFLYEDEPVSFKSFPKLRQLILSAHLILDYTTNLDVIAETDDENYTDDSSQCKIEETKAFLQRIPRSLQGLKLKQCKSYFHNEVELIALIREREQFAPELKSIEMNCSQTEYILLVDQVGKGLVDECREAGIEFKLTLADRFKLTV